jgi:hypothetical protein
MLDYALPSASGGGLTTASDPTRIMFYGYSQPKSTISTLASNAANFTAGKGGTINVPGCLNNGGLTAVPISTQKTYIPLPEFNAGAGDVIALNHKSGTYTALTDYYQGNVQTAGQITMPTCVPTNGACNWQMVPFNSGKCSIESDSGISTISVGNDFIYPEFYEMSGIIAP